MNSEIDYFKIESNHIAPQKGRILISEPFMNDAYFKRAIVFLTEHNSDGSVGFVLNKPINMQLSEIINDFPNFEGYISVGGPVSTNTVHYIHTLGNLIPNSVHVYDGIYWGGDYDVVKQLIRDNTVQKNQIRFFMGYSGWVPNQLEEELQLNSWVVTNIDAMTIMNEDMTQMWKNVLYSLGQKYKMWINSPENPSLN